MFGVTRKLYNYLQKATTNYFIYFIVNTKLTLVFKNLLFQNYKKYTHVVRTLQFWNGLMISINFYKSIITQNYRLTLIYIKIKRW